MMKDNIEMLNNQEIIPYIENELVDEILQKYPWQVTFDVAYLLFEAGRITGIREERARRKRKG